MKTAIIGHGEIGKALYRILHKQYEVTTIDKEKYYFNDTFEIIHICFPYSKDFIKQVKEYKKLFKPKYTVIHSTVPIRTSKKCGAWHSPIIGIHPNLEKGILTFDKYLGGKNNIDLINYFRRANIKIIPTDKQETTELAKILCTTYYGICIEYTKEVYRLFKKNNLPFEFWQLWINNYNKGYAELKQEQFTRPNLIPMIGKIGGHCVRQNTKFVKSKFANLIKELNK